MQNKKWKKFRKKRNNAKEFENLGESNLLRFQKFWKVFLKGENYRKRIKMQKALTFARYCCDSEASNSKSKVVKAIKVTLVERGQIVLRFNAKIISVA